MNMPLYRRMLGIKMKGILNYACGSAFYILLMFWLYPSIAGSTEAIDEMVKAMPEGVANAFGLQSGFGSIEAFISGEYYGLILVVIMSIFCVQLTTQLIARLVDQGSMAYLLATPTTRGKVAFTQAAVFATGLLLIVAATTAAGFAGHALFNGPDVVFDKARFLKLNAAVLLLFFAVGGISFLVSALCNDEKKALGISGAVTFGFFTLDLLGKLSDQTAWLRRFTLFSLYRPGEIAAGAGGGALQWTILAAVGLAAFAIGVVLFRRRDLPL